MAKGKRTRQSSTQGSDRKRGTSPPATRKQIARSRKEQRQLRLIWIGLGAVVALIVIVLTFALLRELIILPNSPVAVVNGTNVSTRDYQALVTNNRLRLYSELGYQRQQFADNEELLQYVEELYQSRLQTAPDDALEHLIEHVLIEEKAKELGQVSAMINFHCILRTLELENKELTEPYGRIFTDIPTIGFSTYGEEYIGHINQTSTILVFK